MMEQARPEEAAARVVVEAQALVEAAVVGAQAVARAVGDWAVRSPPDPVENASARNAEPKRCIRRVSPARSKSARAVGQR